MLHEFAETPIKHNYQKPTDAFIQELQAYDQCVEILPGSGFILGNDYYQQHLPGSIPRMFCRAALLERMKQLRNILAPKLGIYFFDVFRTKATQAYLFNECQNRLRNNHPEFTEAELAAETRKYVSHPNEPTRFTAPPHNTGGAIDLSLIDLSTGKPLNYGSPIDLSEKISDTNFFENEFDQTVNLTKAEWSEAQINRRILFNAMSYLGFTNFPSEWWHYDLGDGMWANALGSETVYHSLEAEVQLALQLQSNIVN